MTERDTYLEALRRFEGDLRMVQQVHASMDSRGVQLTADHYQLILQTHLGARDLPGAHQILSRMAEEGVTPPPAVRWEVALATARAGRTAEALQLLDQLHEDSVDPDPKHARGVLSVYLAADRFPAARAVLRQMARFGQPATAAEYTRLLRDCLDRRAIKDTKTVIDLMLQVEQRPAPGLATELVAMIARAGHTDRALELLDRLREAGVELPGDVHTELLLAHAKAGDAEAAQAALAAMAEAGTRPTSFHRNAVLEARIAAGDADGAWADALSLSDAGRIPSGENLEGLIDVSLASGRLLAASGVLDWMLILGVPVPPSKAADILGRHLKAGHLDLAWQLFEELTARGVPADRRVARDIVERLVKAGRLDEAAALLDRLRAAGTLTHGRHYGPLLQALVAAKRSEEAVALLEKLLANGIAPTSADASKLAGVLIRSKQRDRAGSLIRALREADVGVDEPTYRELLWGHAKAGEKAAAQSIYDLMVAAGITPDDRHQKALEWASGETKRRLPDDEETAPAADGAAPDAEAAVEGEPSISAEPVAESTPPPVEPTPPAEQSTLPESAGGDPVEPTPPPVEPTPPAEQSPLPESAGVDPVEPTPPSPEADATDDEQAG